MPKAGFVIDQGPHLSDSGAETIVMDVGWGWTITYRHMPRDGVFVKKNSVVVPGDIVGLVGNTGDSTAPHLHIELKRNGHLVNPLTGRP